MTKATVGILVLGVLIGSWPAAAGAGSAKSNEKVLATYSTVIVDKFTVTPEATQGGYMKGQETLMQQEVIEKLRKKKNLFDQVLDGTESPDAAVPAANASDKPAVIVAGTITEFKPGNAAKRMLVGYGAGHSTLKMTFIFRDAASGKQLLELQEKCLYLGGGVRDNKMEAATQTAEGMVNELVRDIKKNR